MNLPLFELFIRRQFYCGNLSQRLVCESEPSEAETVVFNSIEEEDLSGDSNSEGEEGETVGSELNCRRKECRTE